MDSLKPNQAAEGKKEMNNAEVPTSAMEKSSSPNLEKCDRCGNPRQKDKPNELSVPGNTCSCGSMTRLNLSESSIHLGAVPESAFRKSPSMSKGKGGSKLELNDGATTSGDASTVTSAQLTQQAGIQMPSKYEIISIREKHGDFRKAIPCMPMPVAVLLCFINVLLPGIGTLFSAFTVLCGCRTEHETKSRAICYNLGASLLQAVSAPIIVGWVWSVLWGITFVNISVTKALDDPKTTSKV